MSEYVKEKTLYEIIEDLAYYCRSEGNNSNIKIILPKPVLEQFSNFALPKERIKLAGEPTTDKPTIRTVVTFSGEIQIFDNEDYDVVKKVSNE